MGVRDDIMAPAATNTPTMANASLMQSFVDGELARSADLIARTLASVQEQLRHPRDNLLSAGERQHHFDLMSALGQHQALYQRRFVESLRTEVLTEVNPSGPGSSGAAGGGLAGLQLMDEGRVETDIEVSRAIQQIDSMADWELRELQTFTSTLRGQDHVTAESNPLRPQAYAQALWQAASALPVPPILQILLLRISASMMGGFLKLAWAAACTRLEAQGVEPSIYRTVVFSSSMVGRRPPEVDVTQPGALDALRRAMPQNENVPAPRPFSPPPQGAARGSSGFVSSSLGSDLENALSQVEAALNRLPQGIPAGSSAMPAQQPPGGALPRLAEHRASLLATTGEMVDRQIIELLSRLFETILSDPSLHSPVRNLLGRLQVPALRIALNDPSMLDDHGHPVWLLMARMAGAAAGYPFPADPRLLALLSFSQALVDHLTAQPLQDAALFRSSLARLNAFLNEQLRQQQAQAQPAIDTLARAEQGEVLHQQLSARLLEQLAPLRIQAPVIRRFLGGPWARLLAHAMLNFGEKDEQTAGYLAVVDELLWSLQVPDHPMSRQRLVALLPGLLQRLRAGMAVIEMPAADQQEVLDELMKLHADALKPGGRTVAPASAADGDLSPEEIMRRLREEITPPPEEDRPAFSDSLIDLASMDTVPAELMPDEAPALRVDPGHWLTRMVPGQRYRIFLNGRWAHVQLLWRSDHSRFFLFAGEAAERTHSITHRALERLREAELVKIVDAHSLIQRAVDAMLRKLGDASPA
jgi:hypothetical protein